MSVTNQPFFECDAYNIRISQSAFSEFALHLEGDG